MAEVATALTIDSSGAQAGAQQFAAAMAAASAAAEANLKAISDNTAAVNAQFKAMNDNAPSASNGFRVTGEDALTMANHIRQAAEASYAFSPAFRGVVNEMAPAALGAANTALAAVAAGIVTATNYAGTGVIALAGAAEKASPALLGYTSGVRAAGIAMEGFSPSVAGAAGSLLSFLSPALRLVGWFALAIDGIKLVGEAWTLGGQQLAAYVAISEKATASGISTDFFQRITKASTDAKVPVDALIAALANLEKATTSQLGTVDSDGNVTAGNPAQARLDQLTKAGNFQGNTGVSDLKNATDNESKYRAVLSLINQAMDAGQRLAALDVAKTFLGQPAADAIAKSASSANDMLAAADKIAGDTLVKQDDVDRANALKKTYDDAVAILEQRWHPIQDLLTAGGVVMQTVWVNIVSNIAGAVDYMVKLLDKITQTDLSDLKWFAQMAQSGLNSVGSFSTNLTTTPESRAASEKANGIESLQTPAESAIAPGSLPYGPQLLPDASFQQRLGVFGGAASMAAKNIKDSPLYKDTSKPVPDASGIDDATAAYDRAQGTIQKYIQVTNAASQSVDAGANEQERLKAVADLTAAGIKDGLTPAAAAAKAQMDSLTVTAGNAAEALAKAKIASSINFGANTAFLSSDDVAIATQLKTIYPDVATALASVEGQALKTNATIKDLSSGIENDLVGGLTDIVDGSKSASQGFSDMGLSIIKTIDQMIIKMLVVEPIMKTLQSVLGFGSGPITLGDASGPKPFPSAHGNAFDRGNVMAFAAGGVVDSPTIAPMALFGEAGPEAIVPLKRGSDGNLGIASSGGGGGGGVSFGDINIQVPEGTSPENASAVGASVKSAMIQVIDQRLAYHSRPRGMLNSGT